MPDVKEWFRSLQPVQLYIILLLTTAFFLTELVVSHLTHALTLLVDACHMLCNIFALIGCIVTIKYGKNSDSRETSSVSSHTSEELTLNPSGCQDKTVAPSSPARHHQERKLKNTFGWARTDVMSMLICCVFLASLCFSLVVEALQTLAHIDHQDEMHHPIFVMFVGAVGLFLNMLCFLLIGGYTFHQGSFLYVNESGDVILNKVSVGNSVQQGQRRLSRSRREAVHQTKQRQSIKEMFRDTCGCIIVIICAVIVYCIDKNDAKYVDPLLAILSASILMLLSYPYMKESCFILLQTIPDTMNIDNLRRELLQRFPDIVNVHDFHVWQLTPAKVISTVHIIFQNPKIYNQIMDQIKEFFLESGITQVTIQPEFYHGFSLEAISPKKSSPALCLMKCQQATCQSSHCCPDILESPLLDKLRSVSKEEIPTGNQTPDLKSVKIINDELRSLSNISIISSEHLSNHGGDKNGDINNSDK